MNIRQLRKLVNETVRKEQRKSRVRRSKSQNWNRLVESTTRRVLREGDEEAAGGSAGGYNDETNTKPEKSKPLIDAMYDNIPLFKEMMAAMGADWGLTHSEVDPDGKPKNGPPLSDEEIAAARDEIFGDKATCQARMDDLNSELAAGKGFSKAYMPAFEGVDAAAVADALDATKGSYGVDHSPAWNETQEFADYYEVHKDEYEGGGSSEAEEQVADSYYRSGGLINESINLQRWSRLAGILKEDFSAEKHNPFPGPNTVMPGAPDKGSKSDRKVPVNLDDTTGMAKAYLEKGKKGDDTEGDVMTVQANQPLGHSDMSPTQREVKLGKTIAFAFKDIGVDMGGSFADNEGNILDGHHRWSGQHMRGFDGTHTQVNIINRGDTYTGPGKTKEFLKMLSTLSTAIGRPTKLK